MVGASIFSMIPVVAPIVAIFVSALALFFTYRFSTDNARRAKLAAAIAGFNSKAAYQASLMEWGGQVSDVVCEMHEIAIRYEDSDEARAKLRSGLSKLTSLIDRGRWLLPNESHEEYGTNKESAFTGLRQPALEVLVYSYELFEGLLNEEISRVEVVDSARSARRQFISVVQEKIEPRVLRSELDTLLEQARTA